LGFLFLIIVFAVIAVLGILGGKIAKSENPSGPGGLVAWGVPIIMVVLSVLTVAYQTMHTVENGHIGIVKEFGSLVGTTGEGFVTTAPWQSLSEVSVQEEQNTYVMTRQENGTAVSSDSQEIGLVLQVRWQLQRSEAVTLYRATGGHFEERILDPAVFQNAKEVTAQYRAIEFAQNREKIRREIEAAINEDTTSHGIVIKNVTIKNFILSDTLNTAIEQTIEAQQQAAREEAKVAQEKARADQAVEQARGRAESNLIEAKAEAAAITAQGRALEANPEVLRLRAIEKLNPNVQLIVPENSNLFLPGTFTPKTGE
jgi:regulator of protease activity HflC (stomatin/prohibitin superfamily)